MFIPADVPKSMHKTYSDNYEALTQKTGKLFLFAADHKMEHLDADFFGPGIAPQAHNPEHIFSIASKARIGCLSTQLGLIARYGLQYPTINYVVKMNSKTNLIPASARDALSYYLASISDIVTLKENSGLNIRGIGFTVYLGSEFEELMITQAAQAIQQAHQNGLVTILYMYPRGKHIKDEHNPHLIAGAVGVANCLGSDFVKIHPPTIKTGNELSFIVEAAGNTKVICAGGKQQEKSAVLSSIEQQLAAGCKGAAIGRNIFEHPLEEAVAFATTIGNSIYGT